MSEPQGQYMGLLHFSAGAVRQFLEFARGNAKLLRDIDMTTLLRTFIQEGREVKGVPSYGDWCEVDTESDLALAETLMASGKLTLRAD